MQVCVCVCVCVCVMFVCACTCPMCGRDGGGGGWRVFVQLRFLPFCLIGEKEKKKKGGIRELAAGFTFSSVRSPQHVLRVSPMVPPPPPPPRLSLCLFEGRLEHDVGMWT